MSPRRHVKAGTDVVYHHLPVPEILPKKGGKYKSEERKVLEQRIHSMRSNALDLSPFSCSTIDAMWHLLENYLFYPQL